MATATFDEIIDAIERLPEDAQANLVEVVRRRLADRERERLIEQVRQVEAEFAAGKCKPMSAAEIVREIES